MLRRKLKAAAAATNVVKLLSELHLEACRPVQYVRLAIYSIPQF